MVQRKLLSCALIMLVVSIPLGALTLVNEKNNQNDKAHVLIVDGFSNHDWQQTTRIVKQLLLDSDLFTVDVSTSPATKEAPGWDAWRPNFADYDVVVQNCNNINNGITWPREVEKSLEEFVSTGGGLYILHSANNAFPHWQEYNKMIGLGWRDKDFGWAIAIDSTGNIIRVPPGDGENTGHGKRVNALLTRMGDHPIHKNFPEQWTAVDLEIYYYARGPAENLTVLSYAQDPKTQLNFPIEWTLEYGKGKVYNSTFGHVWDGSTNPESVRCVAFQTILIRAVEWLGTGKTTWPVPDNFPGAKK